MIPPEAKPSMQGALQSILTTCSADGVPNVNSVSQVWYVDDHHVAVSFQCFNKTIRNVKENPRAFIKLFDPNGADHWAIEARFVREETDGRVFDEMEMQLEAVASMTGMEGVFKLRGAHIYEVLSIERQPLIASSSA